MEKRKLGRTGIEVAPLALGGNVFGWTADEKTSLSMIDMFVERGFSLIDTRPTSIRYGWTATTAANPKRSLAPG